MTLNILVVHAQESPASITSASSSPPGVSHLISSSDAVDSCPEVNVDIVQLSIPPLTIFLRMRGERNCRCLWQLSKLALMHDGLIAPKV